MLWHFVNQLCNPHCLRVNNRITLSIPGHPLRCRGCHLLFEMKKHLKPTVIERSHIGNTVMVLQDKHINNIGYKFACMHIVRGEHTGDAFYSLKSCVVLSTNAKVCGCKASFLFSNPWKANVAQELEKFICLPQITFWHVSQSNLPPRR